MSQNEIFWAMKNKEKDDKEAKAKLVARDRLTKIAITKIKTTMIGALASVEKHFGFLWEDREFTEDELDMFTLYEELRKEILDNGNRQINNIKAEIEQYDVVWNRYTLKLPVYKKEEQQDG